LVVVDGPATGRGSKRGKQGEGKTKEGVRKAYVGEQAREKCWIYF